MAPWPRIGSSSWPLALLVACAAVAVTHAWLVRTRTPAQRYPLAAAFLSPRPQRPWAPATRMQLWKGWGSMGNNATAGGGGGGGGSGSGSSEEGEPEPAAALSAAEAAAEAMVAEALAEAAAATILVSEDGEDAGDLTPAVAPVVAPVSAAAGAAAAATSSKLQPLDDSSSFDGFQGFRGRKVSYSSQPKARQNILFEIWRQRTAEDIAILYKGQHQYSASRRVQEAINEQVSTLLGMFLREPDFQSRLQIQGGQLANLFFKLQVMGYMFANADRVLSASSSLNLRELPRRPPIGDMAGNLTVSVSEGRNVTMQAKDLLGNLVREVEALREELDRAKITREVARQSDLIAFIRGLPDEEQAALTQDIPDYTLDCMRKLVDLALARAIPTVGNQWNPTTPVLIPSKAIFAELCIMQVVQGYLLRVTQEDQVQQLKLFGGLGSFP